MEKEIITLFAKTNFRNKEVPFGIKTDDRRRHMYVIGKTGMGKTTLMENMVIQDIQNNHGVCFIDPHGDSVQKILNSVPSNRINDVIYFNPADLEFPIAFNILEAVDIRYKHLVASGLMGVFTKIWANVWSARMEYILNNTILALLESPGNTLLGITRMYVDKKYRKKIVDNVKDPVVRTFWTDEYANYNEKYRTEAIAPIQNKVGQFLSSSIVRNIVGQPKSSIDLREIMDNRKILIVDISKGRVGEDNAALLGAMLITKLQLAALSRANIPEETRKDFYLYVDEFQNFATDSFATILSEARKYRLNLIVGHQYIAQLEKDKNTTVRDAIFGNVGTMVMFRIGATDAEFLETEFDPIFTPTDLVNLPKYNIILKLMINGVASDPFSAITLPPNPSFVSDNLEKIVKVSRERFGSPVSEVEEKISRWMGSDYHKEAAILIGQHTEQELEDESESFIKPKTTPTENKETAPETLPLVEEDHTPLPKTVSLPPKPQNLPKAEQLSVKQHIEQRQERRQKQQNSNQPHQPSPKQNFNKNQPHHSKNIHNKQKHKPQQKVENPVWQIAHSLTKEIAKQGESQINNSEFSFDQNDLPETPPVPKPPTSHNPNKTVLPQGKTHTF